MIASRIACVGWVRRVALAAVVAGGVAGVARLGAPVDEPWVPEGRCVVPLVEPPPPPPVADEPVPCTCDAITDGKLSVEQQRTLGLACRRYGDPERCYPFEVLATPTRGALAAVIVRRQTGDCGGCGALTIAALFDHHELKAIGELGRYGRFGNGPDGARVVTVAGAPAIELAWSESMGGYSSAYVSVFTREGEGFRQGVCIETVSDNAGASDHPTAWRASVRYRADGKLDVRYTSVTRGDDKPSLAPVTIGFDRQTRRWLHGREATECVTPPRPELIDL